MNKIVKIIFQILLLIIWLISFTSHYFILFIFITIFLIVIFFIKDSTIKEIYFKIDKLLGFKIKEHQPELEEKKISTTSTTIKLKGDIIVNGDNNNFFIIKKEDNKKIN